MVKKIVRDAMNRRKFVSSLGLLGMGGLLPVPSFARRIDSKAVTSPSAILKAMPYLQSPMSDRMTVRWITNMPCHSWVEFGESADTLNRKAETVDHGLVQAYNTVHAITLDDLQPGKKYYYRISSKEFSGFEPYKVTFGETVNSEVYSFSTPDTRADEVSFLVFNDIHDRPESFPHLMQFNNKQQQDFVFLNGDMFNHQTDENQIVSHLLEPLSGLFSTTTPFYFSRGNHETRGKFARQLPEYVNSKEQNFYFSFQYGPIYAIVLDSGEDKPDNEPVYADLVDFDRYRLQQAEWLKKEIQKPAFKKAKYKVVFSHIPLYHSGDWHGTMHCRKVWGPILNDAKIDVLISGHTHKYGIHQPQQGEHNYPIVIGGGPKDGARTLISVKADRKKLELNMKDDKGVVVGNLVI